MQVILTEDVSKLGEMGEIVNVKPGYGRNFLIPQGLAIPATTGNQKELEFHLNAIEKKKTKQRAEAQSILAVLEGVSFSIAKKVSEGDTLYGSVSEREIADALTQQTDQNIHRKQVSVTSAITELGIYGVSVKLASGVFAKTRLWVVAM